MKALLGLVFFESDVHVSLMSTGKQVLIIVEFLLRPCMVSSEEND